LLRSRFQRFVFAFRPCNDPTKGFNSCRQIVLPRTPVPAPSYRIEMNEDVVNPTAMALLIDLGHKDVAAAHRRADGWRDFNPTLASYCSPFGNEKALTVCSQGFDERGR
jgi:hypothetical protein